MRHFSHLLLILSLLANAVGLALAGWAVHRVGGVNFIRSRLRGGTNTAHYQARREHFRQLPKQQGSIVFLGDSITQRCEWAELLGNPLVINRGIDGDKTTGVLARLDELIARRPTSIFLMIGVNDLLARSPAAIADTIAEIVHRLRQDCPDSKLVLQSVLPVNNSVRQTLVEPHDIVELNARLRALAEREGILFVDLHRHFVDANGKLRRDYTHDGIHLGAAGYARWQAILTSEGLLDPARPSP